MAKPRTILKTQIIYQEHDLDDVLEFFANRFRAKILKTDWFIDTAKNKVVFKLVVEEKDK